MRSRDTETEHGMREYQVDTRGNLIGSGSLFLVVGAPMVLISALWTLGVLTVNQKSRPESGGDWFLAIILALFGGVAVHFGWRAIGRLPFAIRVMPDGSVEFQRLLRTTSIYAGDILQIEKVTATVGVEDEDPRMIRLRHVGGSILIQNFAEVDGFIDDLTRRNRMIVVKDGWAAHA